MPPKNQRDQIQEMWKQCTNDFPHRFEKLELLYANLLEKVATNTGELKMIKWLICALFVAIIGGILANHFW